jgi:energy-coupling factor transport system ATP-binding protein
MSIIEIKNLCFSYDGENNVIDDLSLKIEEGKFVSIIGHNGSGKSTLSRLIIGLLTPKSGKITIFGEELTPKTVHNIRSRIGIVFQNPDNQFISSTVEDDIAFGLENKCVDPNEMPSIIQDYADKVGMGDYLKREPAYLSGGQKQRVAIAGVLAMKPDILILDEATSMLDPRGRKEIREVIKQMVENNPKLTIISITHDIEEAYLSDEVIVVENGKVALQGLPEEVFKDGEALKRAALSVPFLYEIKEKLASHGVDVSKIETLDDLLEFICQ